MPILAINKRADFDYEILDKYEAGLVLLGHEVKSARAGNASLKGSFVVFQHGPGKLPQPALINAHISLYKYASTIKDYDPTRPRRLLLGSKEIARLLGKKLEKGLTLVPLRLYTKNRFLKLEFGIGRGKKKYDKRADLKKKDLDREVRGIIKRGR
ncbi:MAG: SsrA-binding protein SmpB [Patescibacteria group bacterium]|jgi:SsrA-binding protein